MLVQDEDFKAEDMYLDDHLDSGDILDDAIVSGDVKPKEEEDDTGSIKTEDKADEVKGEDDKPSEDIDIITDEEEEDEVEEKVDEDARKELVESLSKPELFSALSKYMNDEGLMEGAVESSEDMMSVFAEGFLNTLDPKARRIVEGSMNGISVDSLFESEKVKFKYDKYSDDDIKNDVEIAKVVYAQYLQDTIDDQDEIKDMINYAIDSDSIVNKAIKSKANGVKKQLQIDEKEQQEIVRYKEEAKKQHKLRTANIRKDIDGTNDIFGIELTKADKNKLYDMLAVPVEIVDNNGRKVAISALNKAIDEDPTIMKQINFLYHKGVIGKNGTLDALATKLHSKVAKDISDVVKTKKNKRTNKGKSDGDEVYASGIKAIQRQFSGLRT